MSLINVDTFYSTPSLAAKTSESSGIWQYTKEPVNTGSSVLGVKFNGGVAIAADTLASYGSMARYTDCTRVIKVNDKTILGAGGDFADFQYVHDMIKQRVIEDQCIDDGFAMKPKALYNWLTGIMYKRRSKFDPLWNSFMVAGIDNGEAFLGVVDKLGAAYQDQMITTGLGAHLALPMIRKAVEEAQPRGGLVEQEAIDLLKQAMEVLYYRDARSWPKYNVGIVDSDGVRILGPLQIESNWDIASYVVGYE